MKRIADFPTPNYLYIVQEPRFLETFRPLYKFGMVHRQELNGRFRNYPKQTIPFMSLLIDNASYHETQLKKLFREKYIPHPEVGAETFEGDVNEMMNDLLTYWKQHFVNKWTRVVNDDAEQSPEQWLASNANEIVEIKKISNNRERVSIRKDLIPSDVVEYLLQEIGFKYIETSKSFMTDKTTFDEWLNANKVIESEPVEPNDDEPNESDEQQPNATCRVMDSDLVRLNDEPNESDEQQPNATVTNCDIDKASNINEDKNNARRSSMVGGRVILPVTEDEATYLKRCEQPLTPTQYGWKIHHYLSENGYDVHKTKATIILRDNGTNVYEIENIKCVVHGIGQDLSVSNLEFEQNESPNMIMLTPPHMKRIQRIKRSNSLEEQIKTNTNRYIMFIHSFNPIKFRRSFYFYTTYLPCAAN